ncbi:Rieske (2Fe-2S) protein [Trueperella sp. LYQ143]|uniref:Rieske (2Fe-2S) protein n=1 Tax=unclassified Trueperella TaxID=2630174 RepID=UPI003983C9FF
MTEVQVCSVHDVACGTVAGFTVDVAGQPVAVAIVRTADDRWYALEDRCSHGRVKLSCGEVEDGGVECSRHGSVFNVETGQPLNPPASSPVPTYPVRVDDDRILVTFSSSS